MFFLKWMIKGVRLKEARIGLWSNTIYSEAFELNCECLQ
jgi:hypothetical protein